jgi:hypothetical protein
MPTFDVFLSHNGADKAAVEEIAMVVAPTDIEILDMAR